MKELWQNIKRRYFHGNALVRLIFVNVGIFIVAAVINIVGKLGGMHPDVIFRYFELPSNLHVLITRPWTIITYMFFHLEIFHILFNMLWLFWFGNMFLRRFSERQLVGIYFMGGVSGGILYILTYNILPVFEPISHFSFLLGASASVLAIVVATALRDPDDEVHLMFLGAVKLKYIAIFVVLLSFLNVVSENAGGNIAHLGGALFGFIFILCWKKGNDITRWPVNIYERIIGMFRPRKTFKVYRNGENVDMRYNREKKAKEEEIDAILDKMKRTGYDGLSKEEKQKLFDASKK